MRGLPLVLLAALVACDGDPLALDDEAFGAPYRVVPASARLDGDSLRATVQYSGGCAEHAFHAESQVMGERWEVWLVHDANGDACDAFITEDVAVDAHWVPDGLRDVSLVTPEGVRVPLR